MEIASSLLMPHKSINLNIIFHLLPISKETRWEDSASCAPPSRLRFPRKAAFFTLVAAEALTLCQGNAEAESAASLYLAASHLYSRRGNMFENGDCITRYGWASLRASVLQGLSSQLVEKETAEAGENYLSCSSLIPESKVMLIIYQILCTPFSSN